MIEIRDFVREMFERYGDHAADQAEERAADMLEERDEDGVAFWRMVAREIDHAGARRRHGLDWRTVPAPVIVTVNTLAAIPGMTTGPVLKQHGSVKTAFIYADRINRAQDGEPIQVYECDPREIRGEMLIAGCGRLIERPDADDGPATSGQGRPLS